MGFETRMTGGAGLYRLRNQLKQVGNAGLGKQLEAGLKKSVKPLKPAILAEVPKAMPSGYAPALSKSLQFRMSSKTRRQSSELRYKVYGDGQQERRDVPALNKGTLRSPRGKKRLTWVSQSVPTGFVDRPFARVLPAVRKEMQAVIDDVAKQLRS